MTSLPAAPLRVALVGAGPVGTAVALLLRARGHQMVSVSSRTSSSAEAAARRLEAPACTIGEIPPADLVLIGVPHAAVADVAAELPDMDAVVAHFAGSAGIQPLAPAPLARARCALHPVQACPDVDTAVARLPGSAWGVTCSEGARDWAHDLIEQDLHGVPFDVAEEDRVLWHAAAVTTSNGIAALMSLGEEMLVSIGVEAPSQVLGPIAAGTVANAARAERAALALTGPVVRREIEVVRQHAGAVATRSPHLLSGYVHTINTIVAAALASGRIGAEDQEALQDALQTG